MHGVFVFIGALFAVQIALEEREDLAFVLLVPTGAMQETSRSEIYRELSSFLEERSAYRMKSYEGDSEMESCSGNPGCIALAVRTGGSQARFLVLLSVRPAESGNLFRAMLVDLPRAVDLSATLEGDEFENAVFALAVHVSAAAPAARALFDGELGAILFDDRAQPLGSISVHSELPGVEILIDGRLIGSTLSDRTEITGVRPGERRILFRHANFLPYEAAIHAVSGGNVEVRPQLQRVITADVRFVRDLTFWTGVGSVVLGTAVTVYAFERSLADPYAQLCIGGSRPDCPETNFEVFGQMAGRRFTDPPPRGLPIAPVGYSLMFAGALWAAGTWLGDQADFPWIEISLGLLGGGGALAVSLLLD